MRGVSILLVGGIMPLFAATAIAGACRADRTDAALLVEQCIEVSPATHPPCNAANPCDLIVSEIRRGCGMLEAKDRPKFCFAYSD